MEMLHIHNKLSPLFLLFIYLLAFSSVHSTNPVNYFINCGSDSSVNVSGRTFVGDINSNSSFTSGYSEAIYSSSPLPNTSSLYQTAGLYRQKSQYELSITKHGTYLVRLHFFVFKSQGIKLTDALFNVSTSNFLLLSNFRAQNSFPVIKEFFLTINEGKLGIQFLPSSFAFVNAIEVILLPSDFIMENDTAVRPVKTKSGFYNDLLPEALQTIHRINVGGPEVKEANDSLWRNWKRDDGYVISSTSAKTCAFYNGTYGETLEATEYFAPDIVYRTCKEVKDNSKEADLLKITWRFSVRSNTRHFVRFHFCNNIGAVFGFNLYIDGEKTENINTYNYPNFYDLVVDSEDSGYIKISVGPDDYIDKTAYLNGLEIMEFVMNKSLVVSLEGQPNKSIFVVVGPIIGVLALICILAVVIGLCLRYRKPNTLENWEWSPMPVHRGASSQNRMPKGSVISSHLPHLNLGLKISFAEIQFATNNFDGERIVGKGGFGHVFRGTLRNGTRVAVKRSQPGSSQGLLEFQTEIMVLSKISHRHLVSLIGYCDEMSEMIIHGKGYIEGSPI